MRFFIAAIVAFTLGTLAVRYADAETLHAVAEATRQTLICAAGIGFGALLGLRRKQRRGKKRRPAYAYALKRR